MQWLGDFLVLVLTLGAGLAALGSYLGWRLLQGIRTRVQRRLRRQDVPLIGVRSLPTPMADEDLLACPRRLESLEGRLGERFAAVQQQADVLRARQAELEQKGRRDELTRKYADDLALLRRRAEGMQRVLGLVWKTRAILLVRAHLAQTARRRPNLGRLPEEVAVGRPQALRDGTATYHHAAGAVRDYLDLVAQRSAGVEGLVPRPPGEATIDEAALAAVRAEVASTRGAYDALREDMDRLADNLTWLGDHFATLAVVESDQESVGPDASPGELIREVEEALGQLAELARAVDPAVANAAVDNLAEDIGQLEAAGLEAQAEAEAELEVAMLLRGAG